MESGFVFWKRLRIVTCRNPLKKSSLISEIQYERPLGKNELCSWMGFTPLPIMDI